MNLNVFHRPWENECSWNSPANRYEWTLLYVLLILNSTLHLYWDLYDVYWFTNPGGYVAKIWAYAWNFRRGVYLDSNIFLVLWEDSTFLWMRKRYFTCQNMCSRDIVMRRCVGLTHQNTHGHEKYPRSWQVLTDVARRKGFFCLTNRLHNYLRFWGATRMPRSWLSNVLLRRTRVNLGAY